MSKGNVELVRRCHAHFNATGEPCAELVTDGFTWQTAREDPDPAEHQGLEAVRGYFASWGEMFPGLQVQCDEYVPHGDKVLAWVRLVGPGRESGAGVDMEQAQVWTLREGKAVRVDEYFDRAEAKAAAGMT
jgi:ketosteroid isomerase-like protein